MVLLALLVFGIQVGLNSVVLYYVLPQWWRLLEMEGRCPSSDGLTYGRSGSARFLFERE